MSTTLEGRKAKKKKAYAEFDEYISYQLQKTQTGIRSTDIFTAICGAAVFVISYLLVFVVLDHWVVTGGFGNGMRAVLLVGLLVGTLAWIGWKVVWPCFRRVNSLYAAKALEAASPELKSTLLNYVDLRSSQREVAPAIIGSMEKRAAVTLSHAEVDDAIDRSTLLRLLYALLAAVVLFSVYSVASPKKVWPSIVRIFAPSSDVSVSTQTAFLSVDPGDTRVLAREFLTVTTDLSGEAPEVVTLFFTTADQQFVDEAVPMREVEAGLKRYQCILKGDRGEGLLQGLTYRIAAGDASTQTYHVTVAQPPSASVNEVRYSFPDYMELPPDRAVGTNIDTWEGTKIEISATANMVVESAKLQFSDEAEFPARCEEIRMKVGGNGTSLSGLWQPIIRDDETYPRFYRVQCRTKDGATDPTPVVHSIQIQADQNPDVSTLQPNEDMEVAANAVVPLLIHASDPDFRLSRVVLRMKNGARLLTDRAIYQGDDVEQRVLHELKIADLNAKPGDVITWWAEAHDNRRVETSTRTLLDENRSSTPQLKFLIKAPVSEEEAQEQLERDKQRAEEKLDEFDQRSANDDQSIGESDSGMPDRESDAAKDEPTASNDQSTKKDEPQSEETSPEEQSPNGEESKDGGKGGGQSDSSSDGDDGKQSGDNSGKSDGDKTGAGGEEADSKRPGAESKSDGKKGEPGPVKPVSNDGSQDDEILKELLKQNRDSKPDGSKDGGKKDSGGKNDSDTIPSNEEHPDGTKSDSPDSEKGDKESTSDSPPSKGADTKDENAAETPKDGSPPDKKVGSTADKKDGSSSEDGMPGDEGNKSPKGSDDPESASNSNKGGDGDEPSKTGKTQDDESADMPSDSAGTPDSEKPKSGEGSSDGGDPKSSPGSEPSDDRSDAGKPGEPGKSTDNGDDSKSSEPGDASKASEPGNASRSEPGDANKGGEPGKSDGGSSQGQNSNSDGSSSSEKGSGGKSSAEDGSKSGAGGESKDRPPGSGTSKPSPKDNGKSGDASAGNKPGQSSTDKPSTGQGSDPMGKDGGKPDEASGDEAGSKPDKEGSDSGGDQKSGDAKSGESSGGDAPGKAGAPGEGNSDGGEPGNGSPGAGQSKKPGGNPGQGTGSRPSGSSDPGGEAVVNPDDAANIDDAVQRPNSGANPTDPNLEEADKTNLDDKLKASNMVLRRLKEELDRGEVDPELLKKLGWTEKDMERFAERLERQLAQPKPDDPTAEARRRQFEEVLRNVDLDSSGREQSGDVSNQESTSEFSERRLPAPRSHRKAYEDYIKRLSQQRRTSGATPSGK